MINTFRYQASLSEKLSWFFEIVFTLVFTALIINKYDIDIQTLIQNLAKIDVKTALTIILIFPVALPLISLISKLSHLLFIKRIGYLSVDEIGIRFIYPYSRSFNWQIKWDDVTLAWWSKGFFSSNIILELKNGKEKTLPIKSWRFDSEPTHQQISDFNFYRSVNDNTLLHFFDKQQIKQHRREKHQLFAFTRGRDFDLKNLAKGEEKAAISAIGLTILFCIISYIDNSWRAIDDGSIAILCFTLATIPSLFVIRYLYLYKASAASLVVIPILYLMIFAAGFFLLIRMADVNLGTDVDVHYQLSIQNTRKQFWSPLNEDFPMIEYSTTNTKGPVYTELCHAKLFKLRKGRFAHIYIRRKDFKALGK